ncbi:hypothetical protein ACYULU_02970 [Breznakiellaceae bacterium SP9]
MKHLDWIPAREQDLVDLAGKWVLTLADPDKQTAYSWDAAECGIAAVKVSAFLNARTEYETDDSSGKRASKNQTKNAMVHVMRDFANTSIRFNKKMDDADKLFLGIRPLDTTNTSHGTPTSQPITEVVNSANHFEHKVRALNTLTGGTSKPDDACGVLFGWQVGGERPAVGSDLLKTKYSRRTTLTVTHTEADKAKTAYYASCYENDKGDQGTWSPIMEAVIA